MLNSDRFLDAFSDIEKYIRETSGARYGDSFSGSVPRAAEKDVKVRRYENALIEFAQLRNAIVHGPRGERVLAEPNDQVVAEIEQIAKMLTSPPPVSQFIRRDAVALQAGEPLERALRVLQKEGFSHLPVYEGKRFSGLLTTNAIVKWLSDHLDNNPAEAARQTPVKKVLNYGGTEPRYLMMSRRATGFEVLSAFEDYQRNGQRLNAVLITENGKADESLLGILTAWDLPAIYEAIEKVG